MAGYSSKTLTENWFEDQLAPPGSLSANGDLSKKVARPVESDLANLSGDRYDLLSRTARVPPKTSFAIPNDGFNENTRLSHVDFAHPRSRKEFVVNPPSKATLITSETIPEVCYEERRPIPGGRSGFGAILQRHDELHGQRNWNTASRDSFGGMGRSKSDTCLRREPSILGSSGIGTADMEHRQNNEGVKAGRLVGEQFPDDPILAVEKLAQRSWLPGGDYAMKHIEYGGIKPAAPKFDNELSVSIGEGAMKKIRQDLEDRKGRLFRVTTTITKGKGSRYGESIFADY